MYAVGRVPAHKGKSTTTVPVCGTDTQAIKDLLQYKPRDAALWAVATNCALRAGDLLHLMWTNLEDDEVRFTIRTLTITGFETIEDRDYA